MTVFGGAGGRANEGRMQVDGLGTGAALNGGGVSTYVADISNAQEVVTTNSGGLGEAEVGGPSLNIVPKSGGNTIRGQIYLSGVPSSFVSSNYTEELRLAGLATPGKLIKQWDETFGVGGPIKKDRLWYYATYRDEGQHRTIPGIFPNLNAGDPTKWEYAPDTSRQARGAESFQLCERASHYPGIAAEQVQRPLGRAVARATAPRSHPATRAESSQIGCCRRAARARRPVGDPSPETSGYLRTPSRIARSPGRLRSRTSCCSRPAWDRMSRRGVPSRPPATSRAVSSASPSSRPGTARCQFQLPVGELGRELGQPEHVARCGVVCHRRHSMKFGYMAASSWRTSRTTATTSTSPTRSSAAGPPS